MLSRLKLLRPLMPAGQWLPAPKWHLAWGSLRMCSRYVSSNSSTHLGTVQIFTIKLQ